MDLVFGLKFDYNIHEGLKFYLHDYLPLGATPDALGDTTVLECKSTSLRKFESDWELSPPFYYILQVCVQLMCVGKESGYLACIPTDLSPANFNDDIKLKVFLVHRNDEVEELIAETVKRGYEAYISGEPFERRMKDNFKMKKLLLDNIERIL